MEEIDKQGRNLSTTVWTQLDRKAGAITELTIRQLRNRISTWVVLGVGVLLVSLLLIFYIDSIREEFEPFDNCLLYTSPSPRDQRGSRMPSSA